MRAGAQVAARAVVRGVVLAVALSACQATVRVGVDTRADGGGTVTVMAQLDREAAAAVPNMAQQLRTSDLGRAGWTVVGPEPAAGAGGGVVVTASKPFRNAAEATAVVAEVSGKTGPFRDLKITQKKSLWETRTAFAGAVDLTCGLQCFGDPQLQQALGGSPDLGIDPAKLQANTGVILDRVFKFEVAVRMPGSVQSSNAPVQAGNGAQWQPKLGDKATLSATARAWNVGHIAVAIGLALVVLAAAVVLGAHQARARRRRRRRRRHLLRPA